ncbi:selenobiotic family radical SAM modification target peptide [Oceanidesulfovibrio marinus]|uniref:Selenobiotic family radical SAM modification target peptide n=2 Tax=Oceanidesulfovibrio marinus TaxID=370038 RepID=A0ABX6NCL5_9BACT|nr:selenobiotic family radical SAM modification target peptide [Oceanidesulfovibrio marinus]
MDRNDLKKTLAGLCIVGLLAGSGVALAKTAGAASG